jgi:K+-sensing histidine kinase KdpD
VVFYNLIDNALGYDGGKITQIRFFFYETNAGFILVWGDGGIGISGVDKKRLFERGFGKNTGLGISFLARFSSLREFPLPKPANPAKVSVSKWSCQKGRTGSLMRSKILVNFQLKHKFSPPPVYISHRGHPGSQDWE